MTNGKIRRRQLEKARWMIYRNYRKHEFELYQSFEERVTQELENTQWGFSFVPVTNAFLSIAESAQEAGEAIKNLIPNIRKRG